MRSLAASQSGSTGTWQSVGPDAVLTPGYGLVTGRVSSMALDPSDSSGNHLYIGSTGGGVWEAQNAGVSNASLVVFTPLTDSVASLSVASEGSNSIGALTVQPGGTGVILAGTGDPNDALDSYYGAGILRSGDGGNSWSLIETTKDLEDGLAAQDYGFFGEGFAGFAWGTADAQFVVAAVSQAYEGTLVNAGAQNVSYEGLYYSSDGGASWHLATITDGPGNDVQGPNDQFSVPDGNAATSVVWNPVRRLFLAAVRFHGYYQSSDGMTFTRMTAQPGSGLSAQACPTNAGTPGSLGCPIFRGTLAVNPQTGDTFAWTVDASNQDQGIWQDQCEMGGGMCGTQNVTFAKQWNTQALETSTVEGGATIANGNYDLALAAVPQSLQQGADTLLLAGANDLWKCSLAAGCGWRNTTNATSCMSAGVAEFQHVLAWNAGNPQEILVGNDGGLWRSEDAIDETGAACAASDATHFQNLNGGLGSLAEVVSMGGSGISPYAMMVGLGRNGTAGRKSASGPAAVWPQILGGFGGPVAVDPGDSEKWYVNNQNGVSIYLCADPASCNATEFGSGPVVDNEDVGGDGSVMASPAPFMVDPLDSTQLLIGTCRMWRGPANGIGWSGANAVSPVLDTVSNTSSNQASELMVSASPGFALMQNSCTATLAAGGSCTVGVVFAPTAAGTVTGALIVTSASIGNSATVELTGTGAVAAGIQVTPAAISFLTTGVGLTSSPTAVTVTNAGIAETLSNLALAVPAGFQLVSNTCATALGPGLSCTAGVVFVPTVAGAQAGNLTVTSATASAAQVPLQGLGYDFTVGLLGANVETVGGGQTANFTLVLTPLNLGSGTFALTCGALPKDAACDFSPLGETLNAGATGNVVVGVSTGSLRGSLAGSTSRSLRHKASWGWSVAPLVCGLLLLPLGWRRKSKTMEKAGILLLLAFLAGGVVSCTVSGGGGGSGLGSGGAGLTPVGTYSIPIIVTSTGVSHGVTVTLIVD